MAPDKKQNANQPDSIIRVKMKTKNRLEKMRHTGQSYDGILEEVLNFWDGYYSARRVEPPVPPSPAVAPEEKPAKPLSWWWPQGEVRERHEQKKSRKPG